MRAFIAGFLLLAVMAFADLHYSQNLLAQFHTAEDAMASARQDDQRPQSLHRDAELVENALNSRYMQWGAVGVMLWLFVWIITKQQPRQEERRNIERKEDREAFLKSLHERDNTFMTSLRERDEQYLETLADIRRSVEAHSERHQLAKETVNHSLMDLASAIRAGRS